jgi:nuclear pore complex protein Nup37
MKNLGELFDRQHPIFYDLQVVVAQKNGLIKIFSLDLQHQISSCDCGISPLMGIDWCRANEDIIGAVAGTEWLVFQLSRSR